MTREEAINIMKDLRSEMEDARDRIAVIALNVVIKSLEERPHGEWIEILPFSNGKCSLCGNVANITNFCPNCGARMKEGEEK